MTDFFISYTGADQRWAEWIAYVLEEEGRSVVIQAWDFRPGANFVLEMQKASETASRTIMVLSPDYLKSQFASPEWAAAFGGDPRGVSRKLVPVMVRSCEPKGLLTSIVQIRVADLDEKAARITLLDGLQEGRAKPSMRPSFPGFTNHVDHKQFPGPSGDQTPIRASRPASFTKLKVRPTDIDKRRFLRQGFETIQILFEEGAKEIAASEPRIHIEIEMRTNADLRAEVFVDGKSVSRCRVWIGGMHSNDNICYAEGQHFSDNSCNEIIHLAETDELHFVATMAMGFSNFERENNIKQMDADTMANYLWSRFIDRLQHVR